MKCRNIIYCTLQFEFSHTRLTDLVCCVMLLSRVCALTGSLFLRVRCGLSMPVHSDEAVIQNGFGAGDGPPSLIISCVLDQCRLRVAPKHHL